MAEANAANARARGQKKAANPQLQFRRKLANLMLNNNFDSDGRINAIVDRMRTRGLIEIVLEEHNLENRPINTGIWDNKNTWVTVADPYQRTKGATPQCKNCCRSHCSCNKAQTMCKKCHVAHVLKVNHTAQQDPDLALVEN